MKDKWIQLINRKTKDGSVWMPRSTSVVCSDHFVDGRPTTAHSLPTLNLNYTPTGAKLANRKPPTNRILRAPGETEKPLSKNSGTETKTEQYADGLEPYEQGSGSLITVKHEVEVVEDLSTRRKNNPSQSIKRLQQKLFMQKMSTQHLKKRLASLDKPLHRKLLTSDEQCKFYTCLPTVQLFNLLCELLTKSINYHKKSGMKITPSFISTKLFKRSSIRGAVISKANRYSPLSVKDEVLLVLMKLRLNLMHRDLADR